MYFIGDMHVETGEKDDLSTGSLIDHGEFVAQHSSSVIHLGDTLGLESPLEKIIDAHKGWFDWVYEERDHLQFLPGNHDALITGLSVFGITCPERKPWYAIEHNDYRILLSHGDAADPMNRGDNTVGKTITKLVGWLDKHTDRQLTSELGGLWSWAYKICERVDEWCAEQAKDNDCHFWIHGHTHNARVIPASKYGIGGVDLGAWFMKTRRGRPYAQLDTRGLHLKWY